MVCSDHDSAELKKLSSSLKSGQLGTEQLERVVGALNDAVGEFEGERGGVDGGNQFERRRVAEWNGPVIAGFDDHLQRRLHDVEDGFGHTQIQQRIQQRQLGGRNEVERGVAGLLHHDLRTTRGRIDR